MNRQQQIRINLDKEHHIFYDTWYGYSVIKRTENAISQIFYSEQAAKDAYQKNQIDWYYV